MKVRKAFGELEITKGHETHRSLSIPNADHCVTGNDRRSSPCGLKKRKRHTSAADDSPLPEVSERIDEGDVSEDPSRDAASADVRRRKKRKRNTIFAADDCDEQRSDDFYESGRSRMDSERKGHKAKHVHSRVSSTAEDSSDHGSSRPPAAAAALDCGGTSRKRRRHRRQHLTTTGSVDDGDAAAPAEDVGDEASADAIERADDDFRASMIGECEPSQADRKLKKKKKRSKGHLIERAPTEMDSASDGDAGDRSPTLRDGSGSESRLDDCESRLNDCDSRLDDCDSRLDDCDSSDDSDEMTDQDKLIDSILNVHLCYNGCGRKDSPYDRQTAIMLLARHGVTLSTGRWTKDETDRLRRNYKRYRRRHPEVDLEALFRGTQQLPPDERLTLQQQAIQTHLYRCLAKGIMRPQYIVYFKARRMFHGAASGPYDQSEKEQLARLVQQHGRRWIVIGEILNRSRFSCHDTYLRMQERKKPHVQGHFQPEEDEALCNAVQQCLEKYGIEEADEGIPWAEVAATIPGRTAVQLRKRWIHHLSYVHLHGHVQRPFQLQDRLRLLELVCSSSVTEECHLDWRELTKHFDNVSGAQQLRHYWFKHLKSKVPNHWLLSFEAVCDYLYTRYEPVLRAEVEAESRRRLRHGSSRDVADDDPPATASEQGVN